MKGFCGDCSHVLRSSGIAVVKRTVIHDTGQSVVAQEVIPLVAELAHIGKRQIETDRVRVRTRVETVDTQLQDQVAHQALSVERRPVERAVDVAPPPREEGDATIISLVEERLVVSRQLFVVEEVVMRRTTAYEPVTMPVQLRRMRADVEHPDPQTPFSSQQEEH